MQKLRAVVPSVPPPKPEEMIEAVVLASYIAPERLRPHAELHASTPNGHGIVRMPSPEWHAPEPDRGWFAVWEVVGRDGVGTPISPEEALDGVRAGHLRIDDPQAAFETVQTFGRIARCRLDRYEAPVWAEHERRRQEVAARAEDWITAYIEAHGAPPALLTADVLAGWYGVCEKTILRWDRQRLPASLTFGRARQRFWSTAAVLTLIGQLR